MQLSTNFRLVAGGPTPSSPQGEGEQTPPHPSPLWEGVVTTVSTAPRNCPPETGGTRSEATEGVDITLTSNLSPLTL